MISFIRKIAIVLMLCVGFTSNAQIYGRVKPPETPKKDTTKQITLRKDTVALIIPDNIPVPNDTLFMINNTKLIVNIVDVNMFHVICSNPEKPNEKNAIYSKSDIRFIAYGDGGGIEVVSVRKVGSVKDYESYSKGVSDASICYKHPGGSVGTTFVSFLTGGILGLVPAIICSSTTPKFINLNLPKNAPTNNKDYMLGYVSKAKKMKQKKVWIGYSIGVVGAVAFVLSRR